MTVGYVGVARRASPFQCRVDGIGEIAVGRRADFVVFDDDLRLREVILAAKIFKPAANAR